MIKGLRTVIYHVDDLTKAKDWYSQVLDKPPYFDEPFYVGFNVGGYELGLLPDGVQSSQKNNDVVAHWGVDDADAAMNKLIEFGAEKKDPVEDVGGNILVGTVYDPFGNVFGIIQNPHFKIEE